MWQRPGAAAAPQDRPITGTGRVSRQVARVAAQASATPPRAGGGAGGGAGAGAGALDNEWTDTAAVAPGSGTEPASAAATAAATAAAAAGVDTQAQFDDLYPNGRHGTTASSPGSRAPFNPSMTPSFRLNRETGTATTTTTSATTSSTTAAIVHGPRGEASPPFSTSTQTSQRDYDLGGVPRRKRFDYSSDITVASHWIKDVRRPPSVWSLHADGHSLWVGG